MEDSRVTKGKKVIDHKLGKFLSILEHIPRLCSPTICGTLSINATNDDEADTDIEAEAEIEAETDCQQNKTFEWSIEQAATLFPTNITIDDITDKAECYDVADLDLTWRTKENEEFFSQKTIAPSPYMSVINDEDSLQSVNYKLANNHVSDSLSDPSTSTTDQQDYDEVDDGLEFECDNQLVFSPSEAPNRKHDLRLTTNSPGTFNSLFENDSRNQHSTPKTTSQNVAASKRIKPRRRIYL